MSDPTPPASQRPDVQPDLSQAETSEVPGIAREQFVHGLLEWLHLENKEHRERRIAAMLAALSDESETGAAEVVVRGPWQLRHWRLLSGLAAGIALAMMVLLSVPRQSSAVAMVQASLAASQTAGDRRYEVRRIPPNASEVEVDAMGTLDVRDSNHVVIRARSPFGDQIVVGRDSEGAWAIRPDGTMDRYPPRQAWPPWVNFGQNSVLLVSVDELMTWLEKSYNLKRSDAAKSPSGVGPLCDRITAEHKAGDTPDPPRVELWIDPQSRVVRRMELHWNPPNRIGGADDGRPHEDRPELAPDRPRDRRPGRRPDRGPEFGPPGGGPEDGLDGLGPPEGRPDPGPDGFGPDDGPPPQGRHRPPRPFDDQPLGPPNGPPNGGRRPHPRPEFIGGRPDFAGGHHPPPPRLLVFELVDGASFQDSWFTPAAHVTAPKDTNESH